MTKIKLTFKILLLGVFLSSTAFSQQIILPTQVRTGVDFGTIILVPVDGASIGDVMVGAFDIQYDPAILSYVGITNLDAVFAGTPNVTVNSSTPGILQINCWDEVNLDIFTFPSGKVFDIQFTYAGAYSELTFTNIAFLDGLGNDFYPAGVNGSVTGFADLTGSTGSWHTAGTWTGNLGSLTEPGPGHNVFITSGGEVTLTATGVCNNLTIQSGGQLSVTGTLTNNGDLTIKSDASGTGSLLHNSVLNATVERYVPGAGYHFVSIPVTQAANPVSGLFMGSYLYRFDVPTQAWVGLGEGVDNPLTVNQGYMIWYVGGNITYDFTGALNNGSFTAATPVDAVSDFSLVPNPYPSAIDWQAASGWTDTDFTTSIWVYSNGNYVTYNKTLGAGTGSRYVAVGQSFFVKSTAASATLTMDNLVRVHNGQAFLKNTEGELPNTLSIKVNANNYVDEALVLFADGGSPAFNNLFDTEKLNGLSDAPQLFTLKADDVPVTLNTLPYSTSETVDVPLNFSLNSDQEVTLNFSGINSFEVSYGIQLEDLLTGQLVDLREQSAYTFAHSQSNDASRFVLHFFGVTGVDSPIANQDCKIWNRNEQVYISIPALAGENARIELYDLLGSKLNEINCTMNNPTIINAPNSGVVMVKVVTGKKVYSSKLLIP
jgi:hypothetical protein